MLGLEQDALSEPGLLVHSIEIDGSLVTLHGISHQKLTLSQHLLLLLLCDRRLLLITVRHIGYEVVII